MFDTFYFVFLTDTHATNTTYIESDDTIYLTWSHLTGVSGKMNVLQKLLLQQFSNFVESSSTHAIRLRGGMNPNLKKDLFDVPSLTKSRFMWNGLRSITFVEQIAYPLKNGLGRVTYKDASLLSTAEHRDPGGIVGNPPRAVASARIIQESRR